MHIFSLTEKSGFFVGRDGEGPGYPLYARASLDPLAVETTGRSYPGVPVLLPRTAGQRSLLNGRQQARPVVSRHPVAGSRGHPLTGPAP